MEPPLKEVQCSFLSWECGLHAVTPSEEQSMKGREREKLDSREVGKCHLSQVVKDNVNSVQHIDCMCPWCDVMKVGFTSVVFFP